MKSYSAIRSSVARSHRYIILLVSSARSMVESSEKAMETIDPYGPNKCFGVGFGRSHMEIGSVYEVETNNLPELDIKAKCAFGACRVMLVWESKSVRVMVWSCTLAKYWPPLADIFVYKGLISIVATGAREAAVSGFNLGIADCDVMVQDVALTIRAVANKLIM